MDLETARQVAARIWCDPEYAHVIMNPQLAEEIAKLLMTEANRQKDVIDLFGGLVKEKEKEA